MKKQKDSVVEEVLLQLPAFVKNQDNALLMLTTTQLETIKTNITNGILSGLIEYGKDVSNQSEVRTYARSMVMNHLKKAKELNGGQSATPTTSKVSTTSVTRSPRDRSAPKGVNVDILSDELKEIVKQLV